MLQKSTVKQLTEKWGRVLDYPKYPEIQGQANRNNLAVMLENTAYMIKEAGESNAYSQYGGNAQGDMGGDFKKLAIPLLRRVMPGLIANDLVGVQPMTSPVGLAFAMRFMYGSSNNAAYNASNEAVLNILDNYVTTGAKAPATIPQSSYPAGSGSESWNSGVGDMTLFMATQQLSAGTRKLRTSFSLEMAQDIKALHNLDIDDEMTNMLTYEIQAEIEQEIIKNCIIAAGSAEGKVASALGDITNVLVVGASGARVDDNEFYAFRRMWTAIQSQMQEVATDTRRGPANWILCSPKVVTALKSIQNFIITPVKSQLDWANVAAKKLGMIEEGRVALYLDLFDSFKTMVAVGAPGFGTCATVSAVATGIGGDVTIAKLSACTEYALIGYKGQSELDAGIFYCPYVPILVVKAQDPYSFSPRIGIMSRYAITNSLLGQERYYRLIRFDFSNTTLA